MSKRIYRKPSSLPFWPFAESIIIIAVTLLVFKANLIALFGVDFGIEFDIGVFSVCLFIVLMSGFLNLNPKLATDNQILYARSVFRVLAFVYTVYSLGVTLKFENNTVLVIELMILVFLAAFTWVNSFVQLIGVMKHAIVSASAADSDHDMDHEMDDSADHDIDEHHV